MKAFVQSTNISTLSLNTLILCSKEVHPCGLSTLWGMCRSGCGAGRFGRDLDIQDIRGFSLRRGWGFCTFLGSAVRPPLTLSNTPCHQPNHSPNSPLQGDFSPTHRPHVSPLCKLTQASKHYTWLSLHPHTIVFCQDSQLIDQSTRVGSEAGLDKQEEGMSLL